MTYNWTNELKQPTAYQLKRNYQRLVDSQLFAYENAFLDVN